MNLAILFYSFSGNTKAAVEYIKKGWEEKGSFCRLFQLKPRKETTSFLGQCFRAARKQVAEIELADLDITSYELILFASPVWALTYTPALRGVVEKLKLKDKKAAIVLTYGSGAGKERARKELQQDLEAKGAKVVFSALLRGRNCCDRDYIKRELASFFKMVGNAPVAQPDRAQASGA